MENLKGKVATITRKTSFAFSSGSTLAGRTERMLKAVERMEEHPLFQPGAKPRRKIAHTFVKTIVASSREMIEVRAAFYPRATPRSKIEHIFRNSSARYIQR